MRINSTDYGCPLCHKQLADSTKVDVQGELFAKKPTKVCTSCQKVFDVREDKNEY